MPLTETEARERLERMLLAEEPIGDEELALTSEDLTDLLAIAARADTAGLAPSDPEWEPTWDLNYAASEGWRRKAGRAAHLFNHAVDGASFQRSQLYAQCIRMANEYASKAPLTVTVTAPS